MPKMKNELKKLWRQACEWEGIPKSQISDSKFVVFSENNPFMPRYNRLVKLFLMAKGWRRMMENQKSEVPNV